MRKLLALTLLLSVGAAPAWARSTGTGWSTTESMHTVFEHGEYEFYFNNSATALTSGTVVVVDRTGTGVNTGVGTTLTATPSSSASRSFLDVDGTDGDVTNVGTYITTTTSADDAATVGVVDDDSCANQTYCRVQIYGPRLVRCANTTDAVTNGSAVGSTTVAGQCGGGNGLGFAMSARHGTFDNDLTWVFIRPGGND